MSKEVAKSVETMTRKKALEILLGEKYIYVLSARSSGKEEYVKAIKTIKKDLEVLEIIKEYSFLQKNYKEGYGSYDQFLCNIHTIGMKEDYEKVKKWLENV